MIKCNPLDALERLRSVRQKIPLPDLVVSQLEIYYQSHPRSLPRRQSIQHGDATSCSVSIYTYQAHDHLRVRF